MKDWLKLLVRAVKEAWEYGRKYYLLHILVNFCNASISYVGIIYMSLLVQTLYTGEFNHIISLVWQYVGLTVVLQLISGVVQPILNREQEVFLDVSRGLPSKKVMRMQFHYADNAETKEKLQRILISSFSSTSSYLNITAEILPNSMTALIHILWSIILVSPLWRGERSITGTYSWVESPWLGLTIVAALLLLVGIIVWTNRRSTRFFESLPMDAVGLNAQYNYEINLTSDVETGKEIRIYNLSQPIKQTQSEQTDFVIHMTSKLFQMNADTLSLNSIITQVLLYGTYAVIGIRVLLGSLPLGMIVQLASALIQLLNHFQNLLEAVIEAVSNPGVLQEYYEFMDLPEEEEIGSLPVEKRLDNEYQLAVRNVSFKYPESDELVLHDINAEFEVGKKYAIVGENGSGKTTFIKLLMRLYEPSTGEITLNKIDSRKYKLTEYFNIFSVVFQDFRLLNFPIGENIAVSPEVDAAQAMATLEEVDLAEFVAGLSSGLKTYLGTEFDASGIQVSGGQSQKIAMARALYKEAPIMILDEPTAALDPLAEFEIYQKFDEIVQDKTAFYISHRLSSCRFCDEILVFDEGRIVQRGSHDELLQESGKYQELWQAQAQYYA